MENHITTITCNPALSGMAEVVPGVEYSSVFHLNLTLLRPWDCVIGKKHPLVVFVQGSGWTFPNVCMQLPMLGRLAQRGYAVASVTHRNALEGAAWPAFLQDVKTAIRFLRVNHEKFGIEPDRIGIWGTSSGGNAALLVGLTGDDPAFKTAEYSEASDRVDYVVECFGPTDIRKLRENETLEKDFLPTFLGLVGEQNAEQVMDGMSPVLQVKNGKTYPPHLLLHGDADELVRFDQAEMMHERLLEAGVSSHLVRVCGAAHEGNFWSDQVFEIVAGFIGEHA